MARGARIQLTDSKPSPPNADFAFYIDFKKGVGSPSRVFLATHDFIRACEKLDRDLVRSVDSNIETVMVLEDIEAASLKTWLRNVLTATDDDALKSLDWKKQVGKFLVKAKYAILQWADSDADKKSLPELGRQIQQIAAETDVRHLPDYMPPSPQTLLTAIADFQGVKSHLVEGDVAKFIAPEGELPMDLSVSWSMEDLEQLAVKSVVEQSPARLFLAVKKPDYLGNSQWELRHGKRTIHATMADVTWLKRWKSRQIDIRPGDALDCELAASFAYGHDNELISEHFVVTRVIDVLQNRFTQAELFGDEE